MPTQSQLRLALLCILWLGNPLLYAWNSTTDGLFPDSISYLTLARELWSGGNLFLSGIGHVDTALVLPPVYPLLIAVGSAVHGDAILVSQWISALALLLATIPLLLLLERATNLWMAAAAVAVIQWQPVYFHFGTSTMTEGLFVLVLATLAYATGRALSAPRATPLQLAVIGCLAALLFLTRQVGLFAFPTVLALLFISMRAHASWNSARTAVTASAWVALGFAIVVGPYTAVLLEQGGKLPWVQSFRLQQYQVAIDEQPVQRARPADASYQALYASRRSQRRLNTEATEMLGYTVGKEPAAASAFKAVAGPSAWPGYFIENLRHAVGVTGMAAAAAALLGFVLAWAPMPGGQGRAWRYSLAAFPAGYLLVLSLATGIIARYVEVLMPWLYGLAFVGLHAVVTLATRSRTPNPATWIAVATATAIALLASMPGPLRGRPAHPKFGEQHNPLSKCRALLRPGEGLYSLHPLESYLLGGTARIVPNDSLDRIARYARASGTRWLVFRDSALTTDESSYYDNAAWIRNPRELLASPDWIPRCASDDRTAVLFEVRDAP